MTFQSTVLATTGLQAYYRLGEASGTTMVDDSGSSRDGTYAGTVTLASTALLASDGTATSALFGGGNGSVTSASWMDANSAMSLMVLFKTSTSGLMQLIDRDDFSIGGNRLFQWRLNNGNLEYVQIGGGVVVSTTTGTYNDGVAHLAVVTFDASNILTYVDGTLVKTTTSAGAQGTASAALTVGIRNGGSEPLTGNLQEAAYFNAVLAAGDVTALYDASQSAPPLTVTATDDRGLTDGTTAAVGAVVTDTRGLTDSLVLDAAHVYTDDRGLTDSTSVSLSTAGAVTTTDDRGLADSTGSSVSTVTTDDRGLTDSTTVDLTTGLVAITITDDRGLSEDPYTVAIDGVFDDDRGLTDSVVLDVVMVPTTTLVQFGLGGRRRLGTGMVTWAPAVIPRPASVPETTQRIVARVINSVTGIGPHRVYDYQEEYRARSRHRITVNHKDVTYFRGVETPEPTWTYITPGLYGPGHIAFPQIRSDEHLGVGDLDWISKWAPVHVERINAAGTRTTSYRGMLSDYDLDGPDFASTLAGEMTGRASTAYRPPPIYRHLYDIGGMVKQMIRERLGLSAKGPQMGIVIPATGGRSQMDWLSEVMALSQLRDGTSWTIMPQEDDRAYHLVQKDLVTIDYTLYLDDADTVPHLRRDFMDEPNQEYADSVRPDGLRVRFATYPGEQFGARPPYPLAGGASMPPGTTDADTLSGAGVNTLIWRLFILGFLDDKRDLYDAETADGVRRAQRRAGLLDGPVDGVTTLPGIVDPHTWRALWSLQATGASLRGAHIRPAAQLPSTMKYRLNATGQRVAYNPRYNPHVQKVAQATSMGAGRSRSQTEHWAEAELHDGSTPNWVGTIDITMGAVIAGEHNPGDPFDSSMLIDARGVKPNRNVWVPRFQGGVLFHIAATNKGEGRAVSVTVDTRARDSMKVWEIIDRNAETRADPARNFINANLSSHQTLDSMTPWDDVGGLIDYQVVVPGNEWVVFEVVAGQEGQIRDFDIQTVNAPAEFTVAVFGRDIDPRRLQQLIGNPLTDDGRRNWRRHHKKLTVNHLLLYAAGVEDNPCGYHPTTKPDAPLDFPAIPPADVISGRFKDEAGFPYFTAPGGGPVVRVAIYADRYTFIDPGRLFRVQENDQG